MLLPVGAGDGGWVWGCVRAMTVSFIYLWMTNSPDFLYLEVLQSKLGTTKVKAPTSRREE